MSDNAEMPELTGAAPSLREQELLVGQEFIRGEVCRVFGVPPVYFLTRKAILQQLQQLRRLVEEVTTDGR